jgi:hypothetical protein
MPLFNRELVLACLRALRRAGVTQDLLQHWATWFNHGEGIILVPGTIRAPEKKSSFDLCAALAASRDGCEIICHRLPNAAANRPSRWITAADWLKKSTRAKPSVPPSSR